MSSELTAEGDNLDRAVRRVLADVSGSEVDDVKVHLSVPGFNVDTIQDVRLHVSYDMPEGDEEDVDEEDGGEESTVSIDDLDEEAEGAADFLEGLLDRMKLPGDLQIRVHEDHAEVEVINVGSGQLIGRRGQTLDAIQELLRCALQRRFERRCRVLIDIEGYRARRLEKLLDKAESAIDEVLESGDEQRLEPMDVYERKQIHQLVASHDGVRSSSRGREPTRRVVIERE